METESSLILAAKPETDKCKQQALRNPMAPSVKITPNVTNTNTLEHRYINAGISLMH